MKTYSVLVALYGQEKFSAACAEAKHSPLSVEEILERRETEATAKRQEDEDLRRELKTEARQPLFY